MKTELEMTASRIEQAADYLDVFGPGNGDPATQAQHLKRVYRRLALLLHPDKYTEADEQLLAKSAFTRLGELLAQAEEAIAAGIYGQPMVLATIQTRKAQHFVRSSLARGDLSDIYAATSKTSSNEHQTVIKVARNARDNDLLQTEASALKRMRAAGTEVKWQPFVPELVDSFMYTEKGKTNRQANAIIHLQGFYSLGQVLAAFPGGLEPLHAVWIWRRLLIALGHAHNNNVVHGAVLPAHVMILPEQHGVVLVDWSYASLGDDNVYPAIKAIVEAYKAWYPEEVISKKPPSPATDIAMAARTMVYLMGGDAVTGNLLVKGVPRALRAFFKGCLQTRQVARPSDAWELLVEFDELLTRMGRPYYPRKFRPFSMSTGM